MKRLDDYCEEWYDVLEHFYSVSSWVADMTISYKNKEAMKYGG